MTISLLLFKGLLSECQRSWAAINQIYSKAKVGGLSDDEKDVLHTNIEAFMHHCKEHLAEANAILQKTK